MCVCARERESMEPREAVERLLPVIASPEAHSCEEIITAIVKILCLRGITMEVLRDTCVGAYMRDLCDHSSVQVRSAARIALDCFQANLFDWANTINWSNEIILKACMDADREVRLRASKSARIAPSPAEIRPSNVRNEDSINNVNFGGRLVSRPNSDYTDLIMGPGPDFISSTSHLEDPPSQRKGAPQALPYSQWRAQFPV